MPEPASRRGNVITEAPIEAPFATPLWPFGVGGLNLNDAIDAVKVGQFTRLSNATYAIGESRELTGRPGQTLLAIAGTVHHSIVRVADPLNNTYTRLWGVDTDIYLGQSGALAAIDAGYSGDPLVLLAHRPPLSGQPWVFVGDRARNRKIRVDGLVTPIGLPAPANPAVPALDAEQQTPIAQFDTTDGTNGETWTPNAGLDFSTPPLSSGVPPAGVGATFSTLTTAAVFAAAKGFYQFWGKALTRNLSLVGTLPASDDDLIHVAIKFGNPAQVAECRVYFVVSTVFSASILPGTDGGDANKDFYVKAFRPDDFVQFIAGLQAQILAAETARVNALRDAALVAASRARGFTPVSGNAVLRASSGAAEQFDPVRSGSVAIGGSTSQYVELGSVGIPLRRGDFKRYGNTAGRDWSTVTGMVIYLQQHGFPTPSQIFVTLIGMYLTGGYGPDTADPATQSYDYRFTHYDPRTGAEGNPSPEMEDANFIDSLRRAILVTPQAYGDAAVRQRFYRRGGNVNDNWYFEGVNTSDGAAYRDILADTEIQASSPLAIDHYQAVPTVDDAGATVVAQPVPVFFGPVNGQLFALGDPYRPGHVYACAIGEPDHWPPQLAHEVCAPSEALQNGVVFGGQPFVFSRARGYTLYPNIGGAAGMTSAPSGCTRGLAGRWAITVGAGAIWFVSHEGVYTTGGGPETLVSEDLLPLFHGVTVNGYAPIDFTVEPALRLAVFQHELYFQYQDTLGSRQVMVYQILTKQWRHYRFGKQNAALYADGEGASAQLLIGGLSTGKSYTHDGYGDDGAGISTLVRTGAWDFGRPREEKLLTDQILDVDRRGASIALTNLLNNWTITNPTQTLNEGTGRVRAIFDSFGPIPQKARNIATEIVWATDGVSQPPSIFFLGTSYALQPDLTINRVTQWDDLGHPDEKYVMGITLDCDTGNSAREILIERDYNGLISTIATLTVQANGRHKVIFSWPAMPANQVRIHPNDECLAWLLYRADWIYQPEPPRIATWDIHFENASDQYYTGLDLYCDTGGMPKQIQVSVDGAVLSDPTTGLPYWTVTTTGRRLVHLTLPWGRGHVFHFVALDVNPGLLYSHTWHLIKEPTEQHNLDQPFSILGTQADKFVKAVILEIDSFGQDKNITIEVDGVVVETITVNTNGRLVRQVALQQQRLGRVFRFFPIDHNPARLYSLRLVFDEEPFKLNRWETQETDHDLAEYHSLIEAPLTLKSTADVVLTISCQVNQERGTVVTDAYTIPSTGDVKRKVYVPFEARKGVLYKYLFTSEQPFFLYQEESAVIIQPSTGGDPVVRHPFGNSDNDRTRSMTNATVAAERSGGGS